MHAETDDPAEFPLCSALPSAEPETPTERILQSTPWWSISLGIHVVMALLCGWFWVVQAEEDVEAVMVTPPRKPTVLPVMTPPQNLTPEPRPNLDIERQSSQTAFVKDADDDRMETDNNEEFAQPQGDSLDFVSNKPFKGPGINDTIGIEGGGGGKFGTRGPGGKKFCWMRGGGSRQTEDAVLEALKWLARHQNADGSWSVTGYVKNCKETCSPNPGEEDFDAGVTGLSLLAFLGAGYSHLSRDVHDGICFADVVRKGLQWMMAHQDPEGCIGSRNVPKYMYNHTICALAICEAFGLTGSNLFKEQAQRALDFTIAAQNPGKGWRYSYKCGDSDSSVTGWAVMVLKSAEISGLSLPDTGYRGTRAWYDEVTEETYPRVGYTFRGSGKVFIPGKNEHFEHNEALTAIAVMARIFMDRTKSDSRISNGCDLLLKDKPRWDGNWTDFYYWYYASLALFQFDAPDGAKWKAWNQGMKNALVPNQNKAATGCRRGSWEPVDRWSCEGGRVYATAINALTLEVYYRYPNLFGGKPY